ncbi:MAG: hypothetical protein OEV60_08265 [Actinomycetota bacterium]|nr:hypothetical protein [Actinomycetota bacterium]
MRRNGRRRIAALALLVPILLVACDGGGSGSSTTAPTASGTALPSSAAPESASPVTASDFDPAEFEPGTPVDNQWFPLTPGTEFVLEGVALDEGDPIERKVISTVTDMTKEIAGVQVVVAWERDFTDGELVEAELAFWAQDRNGNVWHLGEYPEEYEEAKLVKSPGWIAGEEGARAGVQMMADPTLDTPSYEQGFAPPPINWVDRGRVFEMGAETCVPVDCYEDVLVIEEFERTKPKASQLKYYAPGVGNVRVGWRGKNEDEHEELELVSYRQLSAGQMEKVRDAVVKLDDNAFKRLSFYGSTTPAVVA